MSLHEYKASQVLDLKDYPFYALIMAAMRRADGSNLMKLRNAFPDTWEELYLRYHAAGGCLPDEDMGLPE